MLHPRDATSRRADFGFPRFELQTGNPRPPASRLCKGMEKRLWLKEIGLGADAAALRSSRPG